jgi:hypothetical protein
MTQTTLPKLAVALLLSGLTFLVPTSSKATETLLVTDEPEDDVWGIDRITDNAIWLKVNGRVTHGDNLILRVFQNDCDTAHLLTSVYTMAGSKDKVLSWDEKEIFLTLNGTPHVAEVLYPTEFLSGYRFLVSFGYTSVENVKALFEGVDEVSMELKDSDHLNVSESVDIPRNTWSVQGAHNAIKRAQKMCRTMVSPPAVL